MILQQLGWSYGHLRQMQSLQKAVQLTTFCENANKSINVVSFKKCYNICDMSSLSCIYGRYKKLTLFNLF